MSFPCTKCGCCCRKASVIVAIHGKYDPADPLYFPYKADETGKCENLKDDNTCAVYETRPLICNIDKFAEKYAIDLHDFYKINAAECNKMMDEKNVPQQFRVVL